MTDEEKEQFYDDHVAPVLLDLAQKCNEHDMAFVAAVEYNPGEVGKTAQMTPDAGVAISMAYMGVKSAPNIDSFMINMSRWCREKKVDISQSVIYRLLGWDK